MPALVLRRFVRPYARSLFVLMLLALLSSAIILALPTLGGVLMHEILERSRGTTSLLILVLGTLIAFTAISIASGLLSVSTSSKLLAELRIRVFDHILRLPISFHDTHRKGDTLALATIEISRLSQFLTGSLVSFPARLFTAIGASILIFRIDPRLAFMVPFAVPFFYVALKLVGRKLRALGLATQKANSSVLGRIDETLDLLPIVKVFTREKIELKLYSQTVQHAARLQFREGRIYSFLNPLVVLVAGLFIIGLVYFAGQRVAVGSMTRSELFSFLFYSALLTRPVGALAHVYGEVQTARGTLLNLERLLSRPIELEPIVPSELQISDCSIEYKDVCFKYPAREEVLRGVNAKIGAGETVAIVGPNGAGKTTLVHLLCGFCTPQRGAVLINGVDIATVGYTNLRQLIALVPQRTMLLNASVRDNILYGCANGSEHDLETAIRLAQAGLFIDELPDGLDTRIGDKGVRLSGGQRQRIGLARALIKNPKILILDEATSMFDVEAEKDFLMASREAFEGRTVLMITHGDRSLAFADRILQVANGLVTDFRS